MPFELFRIVDARLLGEEGGLDIVGLVQALVQWRGSTPDELGIDRSHSMMLSVPGRAQSLIGRGRTGETADVSSLPRPRRRCAGQRRERLDGACFLCALAAAPVPLARSSQRECAIVPAVRPRFARREPARRTTATFWQRDPHSRSAPLLAAAAGSADNHRCAELTTDTRSRFRMHAQESNLALRQRPARPLSWGNL